MRTLLSGMLAVVMLAGTGLVARQADKGAAQVMEQYQAAWNKGDAKALAALYAENSIRIGADAVPVVGRPAIEESFVKNFAGPWKGSKLTTKTERTQKVSADVEVIQGTYELTGGSGAPQHGRFLDTLVRENSHWRIAALAAIPQTSPAR